MIYTGPSGQICEDPTSSTTANGLGLNMPLVGIIRTPTIWNGGNVGHAPIHIGDQYISLWPEEDINPFRTQNGQSHISPLEDDMLSERCNELPRNPDYESQIKNIDVESMLAKLRKSGCEVIGIISLEVIGLCKLLVLTVVAD